MDEKEASERCLAEDQNVPSLCFQCNSESALVSGEEDIAQHALSCCCLKHQRHQSESFLSLFGFEWKWDGSVPNQDVFIKHSVWAKITLILGEKVTFTAVIFSTSCFPKGFYIGLFFLFILQCGCDYYLYFRGPYITVNGPANDSRMWLSLFLLTWGKCLEASWVSWLMSELGQLPVSLSDTLTPAWN